jgi:hypothetical protein
VGSTVVSTIPVVSGKSAHFEYVVYDNSGVSRAGLVISVWNSTNASFTDTSTPDLDGDTSPVRFIVTNDTTNIVLTVVVSSGIWNVLVGNRIIF